MREYDYSNLADRTWDNEIISYISQIHEFKGKQELFLRQRPVELDRLIEIAKVQSTEASNRIEGIITTNSRLKQLVADKTTPKNRDEEEILGYRNVLNLIHESYDAIPVRKNYILQLHKELLKYTDDFAKAVQTIAQKKLSNRKGAPIGTQKIDGYVSYIHDDPNDPLYGTVDVQEFGYDPVIDYPEGFHEGVQISAQVSLPHRSRPDPGKTRGWRSTWRNSAHGSRSA